MTITQLEYIVALDSFRHFVTAAEKCFITQPSLSAQVKKLEDELGVLIFDRGKNPMQPTKQGAEVIVQARQILRQVNLLKEYTENHKQKLNGAFRLGIIPTLAPYLLPRFLGEFMAQNLQTKLIIEELQSATMIDHLKHDLLDLGIMVTPVNDPEIIEYPIFNEAFLGYLPENDRLLKRKKLKHKDAIRSDLWILNEGHCFRNQVINICNPKQVISTHQHLVYESGSIEALKKLVDKNMGFTLLPELAVIDEIDSNPKIKRFEDPQPIREVSLVTHRSFGKKRLVEVMINCIETNLPERLRINKKVKMIPWK